MVFNSVSGSDHVVTYVPETVWGTTPATPTMMVLRHTGFGMKPDKSTFESKELGQGGQVKDLRHGPLRVAGDIPVELSYGSYDDFIAAVLRGAWATDVLKVGATDRSFSLESIVQSGEFELFPGVLVNSLNLDIKPEAIVTGTFGCIGQNMILSGASVAASTTPANANSAFDAFTGTLSEGGVSIATVTGVSLTIENGYETGFVVGASRATTKSRQKIKVSGSLDCYYKDASLLQKFLNETVSSLALSLEDVHGNTLSIALPRIKYSGASKDIGDGPIMEKLSFVALYDETAATTITFTRTPA
ncbi:hypothetical protein GGQ74_001137 [Desulfobaculum xiamenense]|uniref:Tail protein n=1 Tax=Desulfobaculum xiamenense TaxID=995050 RepID=A0A846QK48_9BACT|nr:phage tail tube protein [Desulfobaculum xiamenense]NJB67497.1 hypothetical protein [Desulfobaculum xiamenense]